ncbi:MAG: UDP-GlcNAc3NAcA epimerase [Spirosomataceae bacterium]|jgi:UDP-GlcNAc3NAcA epimerase
MTDSGGVRKEAFFFEKPYIIFGAETEWTEIVDTGMAILTGSSKEKIMAAFTYFE